MDSPKLLHGEAKIRNLSWTHTDKTTPWRNADLAFALGAPKKPMLCLHAITDATLTKMKGNRAGGYVNIGVRSLKRALKARSTIAMKLSCGTFRRLLTTYVGKSAEMNLMNSWLQIFSKNGSQFIYNSYKHVIESGTTPTLFAEQTVFIPTSSDIDNNGRMVRLPDTLRSLTLCNCDCKILTTAICRGLQWYTMRFIHPSQRCISARQMTDNIFEIETTALANVACCTQESDLLLTDFAAAYPIVNHSLIFHVQR